VVPPGFGRRATTVVGLRQNDRDCESAVIRLDNRVPELAQLVDHTVDLPVPDIPVFETRFFYNKLAAE
jgi:hypothetical protein